MAMLPVSCYKLLKTEGTLQFKRPGQKLGTGNYKIFYRLHNISLRPSLPFEQSNDDAVLTKTETFLPYYSWARQSA
jgi:hypothetical protein